MPRGLHNRVLVLSDRKRTSPKVSGPGKTANSTTELIGTRRRSDGGTFRLSGSVIGRFWNANTAIQSTSSGTTRSLGASDGIPASCEILPTKLPWTYDEVLPKLADALDASTIKSYMVLEGNLKHQDLANEDIVVVVVKEKEYQNFAHYQTFKFCSELLRKYGLNLGVFPGNFGLHADEISDPANATPDPEDATPDPEDATPDPAKNPHAYEQVDCGSSLGPEPYCGESWSGTFGGYVRNTETGEVFGMTCGHNACCFSANRSDLTPGQMLEMLPVGSMIYQPSPPDHRSVICGLDYALKSKVERRDMIRAANQFRPSTEPLRVSRLNDEIDHILMEKKRVENIDTRFARTTSIYELDLVGGKLMDYLILDVQVGERRRGFNYIKGSDGVDIALKKPTRKPMTGNEVIMAVGRTSGSTQGRLAVGQISVKLERFPQRFSCDFGYGRSRRFTEFGDSGAWVLEKKTGQARWQVFGFGSTDLVTLEVTWMIRLSDILDRIGDRWGRRFEVYTE